MAVHRVLHKLREYARQVDPDRPYRVRYFATYQALDTALSDDGESDEGVPASLFESMPTDFFDLVIVDECHRGSSSPSSSQRGILDHFAPAVQVFLT
jgi:type I restriction enzyme R subunit